MSVKLTPRKEDVKKSFFEREQRYQWIPERVIKFGKIEEEAEIPDLLEIQKKSYDDFLQKDILPAERKRIGLEEILKEVFPIEDRRGRGRIDYEYYMVGNPKYTVQECIDRGITYSVPIRLKLNLITYGKGKTVKEVKSQEVYLGDFPLMTEKGTFIYNGAERIIVSQLHRSPGITFGKDDLPNGKKRCSGRIIPFRGSWVELQIDTHDTIQVIIDNKNSTKMPITTFLRCFGIKNTEELFDIFFKREKLDISEVDIEDVDTFYSDRIAYDHNIEYYLARPIVDKETGEIPIDFSNKEDLLVNLPNLKISFMETGSKIAPEVIKEAKKLGYKEIEVYIVDKRNGEDLIINTFRSDKNKTMRLALLSFWSKMRPGTPAKPEDVLNYFKTLFQNPDYYDLKAVGKYKIEAKFGKKIDNPDRILKREYIEEAIKYLCKLYVDKAEVDDIDHLGNRRVRPVGELIQNQVRKALVEMKKMAEEKMQSIDQFDASKVVPSLFISTKVFGQYVQEFFGRSQLSQFMDQTNPLAELTNKRRLSALGPGGLTRERAGFEVRDVHYTHYGRICPIETPEGQNIGLISSLTVYARVNELGFIETPYKRVVNGKVTNEVVYLSADEEENYCIAQANAKVSEKGELIDEYIFARKGPNFGKFPKEEIDFIDVSPKQMVSVSSSLIPFLEHDDANRALMGSNMQRQAVPLLFPEQPMVATGMEEKVARDSGACIIARRDGVVKKVDANEIIIEEEDEGHVFKETYQLRKFNRSNQNTCINHRPIVKVGDKVKKGQVIADGPAVSQGKLALGRNVLVAFMPWHGYNFEDAILISERLVKDDVYTSIYIEELEVQALQMGEKLGSEEITKQIKGEKAELLEKLDDNGIIRVGTKVKPGDILVGKLTPKGEDDLTAEERLLRAIFGDKTRDMKNTSLKVPSGLYGTVVDVKVFKRKHSSAKLTLEEKELIEKLHKERETKINNLKGELDSNIRKLIRKAGINVVDIRTGEILYKVGQRRIRQAVDKIIEALKISDLLIVDGELGKQISREWQIYKQKLYDLEEEYKAKEKRIREGEELPPGVNCIVKVYIAQKRKVKVGDKMAGRHGNKGVISKILPIEDMPFLEDGTPVDVVLNPLGVPSRMNVGQILETHLGWAAAALGYQIITPVFEGAKETDVKKLLKKAGLPESGQTILYDGLTGEPFSNPVTVGYMYMLKLSHMVEDKIHARSIGPYSLVTQQPLGGRSQYGGQRIGEMEVWAFEGFGAAYTLQELLTIKSDDVKGRDEIYINIFKGKNPPAPSVPESFNVLVKELQALAIDIDFLEGDVIPSKEEIALRNESYDIDFGTVEEEIEKIIEEKDLLDKEEFLKIINEENEE